MALCLCVFTACEKDEPIISDEPTVPPTEQPEQPEEPETPVEPEEPDTPNQPEEPQEPMSTDGIINWNNEFIITGKNMATVGSGVWRSIAFGNGKYVAVGVDPSSSSNSFVTTSTDGVNWTVPKNVGTLNLKSVVFGNGKFIAIAGFGSDIISVDGENWTEAATPTVQGTPSITFGNGKFLYCGGTKLFTSTDGVNWTEINIGLENATHALYFANGMFFISSNSGKLRHSSDGVNWSEPVSTGANGVTINDIAYGNGIYIIAVGKELRYSTDLSTWNKVSASIYDYVYSVSFSNGKFMAGLSTGWCWTSNDGLNWERKDIGIRSTIWKIIPFNN